MIIELRPEDEELIQKRLDSGAFASVEEIIHRALETLDADETWLQENKRIINDKIERGLAELDRSEGISGEESRARLQEKKAAWLKTDKEP
jgi:Arc/MetJ-type ribon-helix-helix transcriptional regulator